MITILNILNLLPFLKRYWIHIALGISTIALIFGLGWTMGKEYVKNKDLKTAYELLDISKDSVKEAQNIADELSQELEQQRDLREKENEKLNSEISRLYKSLNDSNCKRTNDWLHIYNESAKPRN